MSSSTLISARTRRRTSGGGGGNSSSTTSRNRAIGIHTPNNNKAQQQFNSYNTPPPSSSTGAAVVGPLFVQKNGVVTFRPCLIRGFLILGIASFLGIHIYLLKQFTSTTTTTSTIRQHPPTPLAISTTNNNNNNNRRRRKIITPLRRIDQEQYTIRINTWQRIEQLIISIEHHLTCPGVAQIQIVWCDAQGEPPTSLLELVDRENNAAAADTQQQQQQQHSRVVLERHSINSLNERFHILPTTLTPTLGILSIDDDVLRPCIAIDSGFFQWIQSPHRMVGFDYRVHVVDKDVDDKDVEQDKDEEEEQQQQQSGSGRGGTWKYGYLSTTQKENRYSMSLPRYAFIHKDYFDWYMNDDMLPKTIFDTVANSFNCEDIAMSFFVSSLSDGRPPLLANFWSIETMIKLYSSTKISSTKNHKSLRDNCVDTFANELHLKQKLYKAPVLHRNDTMFYCGDQHYHHDEGQEQEKAPPQQEKAGGSVNNNNNNNNLRSHSADSIQQQQQQQQHLPSQRQQDHFRTVDEWQQKLNTKEMSKKIFQLKKEASVKAQIAGFIEHSEEWKKKFNK